MSACYLKGDLVWCVGLLRVGEARSLCTLPPMESTIAFSSSHTAVYCMQGRRDSRITRGGSREDGTRGRARDLVA